MAMVPMVSAGDNKISPPDSSFASGTGGQKILSQFVDLKEAEAIALFNVRDLAGKDQDLSVWKEAEVRLSSTYYDLNDQKTAYAFSVLADGQDAGYILISATTENYPVLALSRAKIPGSEMGVTERAKRTAESVSSNKGMIISGEKKVYLGGLDFYHKYDTTDSRGLKKEEMYIDLHSNKVVDFSNRSNTIPDTVTNAQLIQFQKEKQKDFERSWSLQRKFHSNDPSATAELSVIRATTLYSNTVSGVPLYFWTRGCAPTAAGMVVGYRSTHGYPCLPLGTTLINELADRMNTNPNGLTWPYNIGYGINMVLNHYQYYTIRASDDYVPNWNRDVAEIDASRPFVLSMWNGGAGAGRPYAYGDHSVACIGYMNSVPQLLKLYDTWYISGDPTNYSYHWIQYNNWNWAMNTYVR